MESLTIAGMLCRNDQACYGCVAVSIPEDLAKNRFRLVSDSRAINDQASRHVDAELKQLARLFAGDLAFCILNPSKGWWQMPMGPAAPGRLFWTATVDAEGSFRVAYRGCPVM